MQKILDKEFGKGKYNIEEAMQDVSLIFSNSHELIDIARPTISKVIPIGGLAMIPPKPLTEVKIFEKVLEKSNRKFKLLY